MEITQSDKDFLLKAFVSLAKTLSTSSQEATEKPSTQSQMSLLYRLEGLLSSWGQEVQLYPNGYLLVTLPPTEGWNEGASIGFLAHVDTSPDCSGENVKPCRISSYQGGDIQLPNGLILSPQDSPELLNFIGDDIITSDGETLLGADDKAGVAILLGLIRKLKDEPHGRLQFLFTTDEEVGRGMENPPLEDFNPQYAFTFDGGTLGEIEYECFNAVSTNFEVTGKVIHLGQAKGKLINAIEVANQIIKALPKDESPEASEGLEGYYCPISISGALERASFTIMIRDFDKEAINHRIQFLDQLARKKEEEFPGAQIQVTHSWQYQNMKDYIPQNLIDYLHDTMEALNIEEKVIAVRGGTDGARLSELGIPCPNLFVGGHNIHSRLEWLSVSAFYEAFRLGLGLVERAIFLGK